MLSFTGRSRRRSFVTFALLLFVVPLVLDDLGRLLGVPGAIEKLSGAAETVLIVGALVAGVFVFVAWIAAGVRRLHDMNLSGWFYLLAAALNAIPYVGPVIFFAWLGLVPGSKGTNRFGPDPRGPPDAAIVEVFDAKPTLGPTDERVR